MLISATVLLLSLIASAPDAPRWVPPAPSGHGIVNGFSLPGGPYRAGHRGIDYAVAPGSAVLAPQSGTVSFVGVVVDRPLISIRVDERTVLTLEPVSSDLAAGDAVARGQVIGAVAAGGHCEAECLHLGVRVADEYVNPLRYLRSRPRLLPWSEVD